VNIIGVDPGLTGACAVLDEHGGLITCFDLPVIGDNKQRRVDAATLADLIRAHMQVRFAIVEQVHAMPGQGVSSTFKFGMSYGAIYGILGALVIPVRHATAPQWKKASGLDSNAETSRARAIETWPDRAELFARKMDHNRAEAALLARFALRAGA
jgi:crossover junction endodeoxyribonuclease RuvC